MLNPSGFLDILYILCMVSDMVFMFLCRRFFGWVLGMVAVGDSGGKDADRLAGSERFLLKSAEHLQKGIEYAVRQLNSRKIGDERKMRWIRSLTRQIEALVKVVEALHNIGSKSAGGLDLATYLSSVRERVEVPVRESRAMHREALEFDSVVRQASLSEGGVGSVGRRRTCRDWR